MPRPLKLLTALLLTLTLACVLGSVVSAQSLSAFEQQVVDLVNQQRAARGLPALRVDWRLVTAARRHNDRMRDTGQVTHQLPGQRPLCAGGDNNDRYDEVGYSWIACGENVAAGQSLPREVVDAWMNSSGHRDNILSSAFRDIGVAYASGGGYGHFWTQDFGASDQPPPPPPVPSWTVEYGVGAAPTTWQAGQWVNYTVSVRNGGSAAWPAGGDRRVRLGARFVNSSTGVWLTDTRFDLPHDIGPGGAVNISVWQTAPVTIQPTTLVFQLVKEHEFWFNQAATRPASVFAAEYHIHSMPGQWWHGQAQSFSVTVRNVGNAGWHTSGTQPVRLGAHFTPVAGGAAQAGRWYNDYRFNLPHDVPPGGSFTRAIAPIAPATRGTMLLELTMLKEQLFWFNQSTHRQVTVN